MSITTNVVVLVSQTLKSAISIVRGLGGLPDAVASRVARAHLAADRAELARSDTAPAKNDATERLRNVVEKLEARGMKVVVGAREERIVVALLPPLPRQEVESIVAGALREIEAVDADHDSGKS